MMNTNEELKSQDNILSTNSPSDTNSESQSHLEEQIEEAKTKIKKDRFLFFLILVVLFDVYIFTLFMDWAPSVCITIIEVFIVLYMGRIYDIEEIELITDKILIIFKKNENK